MILFDGFRIDDQKDLLFLDDQAVKIEKLPLKILVLLIRERHRVVSREEIAEKVWGKDKFVEAADGINTGIRKIRRALGDTIDGPRYIQTVVGFGYRFVGEAQIQEAQVQQEETDNELQIPSNERRRKFLTWIAVAVACIIAVAGVGLRRASPGRAGLTDLVRLTTDTGYTGWPNLSPDGKMIVYASNRLDADNLDIYIQAVAGNEAIRLTADPARDIAPVISPSGSQVAFESYRDPPGIYVMPILGGEARLLAAGGSRPRYSPDGQWVAYFKVERAGRGSLRSSRIGSGGWSAWIVPAAGGEPRPLRPELRAGNPVWAGNDLLILTGTDANGNTDWWLTPRDGGWVRALGVHEGLLKLPENFPDAWRNWSPAYVQSNSAVFSARTRDTANLWRLRFTADWKPLFPPQRLTMMNDHVLDPSASDDGRIAAGVMSRNLDIYEVLLDADSGTVKGEPRALTRNKSSEQFVSVTEDGTQVVYTSWRADKSDLYSLDTNTGVERQLTATPEGETFPRISADGKSVVYRWHPSSGKLSYRRSAIGRAGVIGPTQTLCEGCAFMDYTAEGKSFLYGEDPPKHIFLKDFAGGDATEPVSDASYMLCAASLDGANHWLVFVGAKQGEDDWRLFAAPFRRNGRLGRKDWVELGIGLTPLFSPNGEWIYFDTGHDGFRCLWKLRFDPINGHPIGVREPVAHIHGDKRLATALAYKDRGLARNRIVFSVTSENSNIWLMR